MSVTRIEQPKALSLVGAAPGEDAGETSALELDAGDYEVRCSAPVRIRLGRTSGVSSGDLLVLPEAPAEVALSGTVSCAAASAFGTRVWFTPLKGTR